MAGEDGGVGCRVRHEVGHGAGFLDAAGWAGLGHGAFFVAVVVAVVAEDKVSVSRMQDEGWRDSGQNRVDGL